jgi:hypothetical protein
VEEHVSSPVSFTGPKAGTTEIAAPPRTTIHATETGRLAVR